MKKIFFSSILLPMIFGVGVQANEDLHDHSKKKKHSHAEKDHKCGKCKKAEKDCKCDESHKDEDHTDMDHKKEVKKEEKK